MSEPEEVNAVFSQYIARFAPGLDRSECLSELWIAYLEAGKSYPSVQGCCPWEDYLLIRVNEAIQALRAQRDRRFRIHSRLSLDQPVEENGPSMGSLFPARSGNFERSLLLWDYIDRLEPPLHTIAGRMAQGGSAEEIMGELTMDPQQFSHWKDLLRQSLEREYL